jgi:hypothetical protein
VKALRSGGWWIAGWSRILHGWSSEEPVVKNSSPGDVGLAMPPHRSRLMLFTLTALAVSIPLQAHAEPMLTRLADVVRLCRQVVIARYLGHEGTMPAHEAQTFRLKVERSLVGTTRAGVLKVKRGGGAPAVKVGERVVAFLDAQGAWRFVATADGGAALEKAPLRLRGFYDFNAHLVDPGLITLPALTALYRTGGFTFSYSGPILVLGRNAKAAAPSGVQLRARGTWQVKGGYQQIEVTGLPPTTRGLPKPQVWLSSWEPEIVITYRSSWPRPLIISGRGRAVDAATGEVRTDFRVTEPDLVTADLLRRYLAQADAAYLLWHYELRLDDGRTWRLSDGAGYGSNLTLTTDGGVLHRYQRFDFAEHDPKREVDFSTNVRALTIRFAKRRAPLLDSRGTMRQFHQELSVSDLDCQVFGEGAGRSGRLSLKRVELPPPIRAR